MKNKKRVFVMVLAFILLTVSGCQQMMTKSLGGNMTINLEPNLKLEEITWKNDNLWYLTKPMVDSDIAEIHTFQKKSELGIFEGSVIIIESKADEESVKEFHEWNSQEFMTWDEYIIFKENGYTIEDITAGKVDYSILYED